MNGFVLIGVNHKTAPVEVRERLAVPESRLPEVTKRLAEQPGIEEAMIISTCNRVELLARASNGRADLRGFIREHLQVEPCKVEQHLYEYREREAVRHLFRVTSSLDSMVVGEPQILGQVKQAFAVARGVGAVNSHLDALVARAFAVAKRVRSETAIGASAVSVASVAVELAQKIFGSLQGRAMYLIGAGKMSELAARRLLTQGAAAIFVANRTYEKALEMAERFGSHAIHFDKLYETADKADIVITSTGAPHTIFRREHGERFLARRRHRPMFFIDIAVPRDVDPAMNELDGIFVYDIDDLQQVAAAHVADRKKEAARAEQIIDSEVERFLARVQASIVVPTIVSLQEHLENIRQAEVERVRGRLGQITPEQDAAIEALTRGIINKILHTPITALKSAARDQGEGPVVDLIRRIFNLEENMAKAAKNGSQD
ncbi:MAG TPA: glutamyl-tRNA reductase [Terriglobales bacterium]|jgi:glutamyl-tRNA reductase|nr:glutamyl-tRNA reductase [Terriglobales bacterium]